MKVNEAQLSLLGKARARPDQVPKVFSVGLLVACAGNEHARHAEVDWVPTNLCVPVPAGLDARLACFVTVGAIAMHGVRRGEVELGESACMVGLGLIGQLVVRLLL